MDLRHAGHDRGLELFVGSPRQLGAEAPLQPGAQDLLLRIRRDHRVAETRELPVLTAGVEPPVREVERVGLLAELEVAVVVRLVAHPREERRPLGVDAVEQRTHLVAGERDEHGIGGEALSGTPARRLELHRSSVDVDPGDGDPGPDVEDLRERPCDRADTVGERESRAVVIRGHRVDEERTADLVRRPSAHDVPHRLERVLEELGSQPTDPFLHGLIVQACGAPRLERGPVVAECLTHHRRHEPHELRAALERHRSEAQDLERTGHVEVVRLAVTVDLERHAVLGSLVRDLLVDEVELVQVAEERLVLARQVLGADVEPESVPHLA